MKICIYDDSIAYGGHQIMASLGAEALCSDHSLKVRYLINPNNVGLADRCKGISNLEVETLPSALPTAPLSTIRLLCRPLERFLSDYFTSDRPDLLLVIQGDVGQSASALRIAKKLTIPCISYLALAHKKQETGATLARLRDTMEQRWVNLPDRYITISESMRARLLHRGVRRPIDIVQNGVASPSTSTKREDNRGFITLGVFGRIEFKQKQQDFMVRVFCEMPSGKLLLAGAGPDEQALQKLIKSSPKRDDISLLPWVDEIDTFFDQIDILVIPSRYEGVPLVMLEALARGIPVLGSARDGMKEWLPEAWTFEPENARAFVSAIESLQNSRDYIEPLQRKVHEEMTVERFKTSFRHAVLRA